MSDVRTFAAERAAIVEAVVRRVGADRRAISEILDEMAGGFSAPLYRATIALLPHALATVFGGPSFQDRVTIEGPLDELRALATRATLVLAPTHASNLDSIVLGLVTGRAGLPPFAYAAGKHIFRNCVLAALMRRLGAYQLDPDRRDRLYLRVVNVYVNELLARGYHTVVFPSGTRGRSGCVESTVKLGLLGAAVHVAHPVAIVPVAISYQVVLEAEHLIAYYLAGRSHERIVGDELFAPGRLADTARRLARLDQRVVLRFAPPIDPHARGAWRSRIASELTAAYRRDTVFFATHVAARALFDLGRPDVPVTSAYDAVARVRERLAADPGSSRIWRGLDGSPPAEIVDAALHAWNSWHRVPPVTRRGSTLAIANPDLVLYYRNRTAHIA
jgi:glycerol-3-phosphate O-acyltransferase